MKQQAHVFGIRHHGTSGQQQVAYAIGQRERQRLADRHVFLGKLPRFWLGHEGAMDLCVWAGHMPRQAYRPFCNNGGQTAGDQLARTLPA